MDVKQGIGLLMDYYSENDIYNPISDFKKLNLNNLRNNPDDELPPTWEIELGVQAALNDMIKEEFVRAVEVKNSKSKEINYVIFSTMRENGCHLELSKQTCKNVANVVNSMLPFMSLELSEQKSDPKRIGEADVIILLECIKALSSQLQENIKNQKSPPITPNSPNN
jgi:hypothetical protein